MPSETPPAGTSQAAPAPAPAPVSKPLPEFSASPFPANTTMMYCIGAQKAGTSWLHEYLSRSDEVYFSPNKELHYFDVRAGRAKPAMQLRVNQIRKLAERLPDDQTTLPGPAIKRMHDDIKLLNIYTGAADGPDRHRPYLSYLLAGHKTQKIVGDITPSYSILDRDHFADMASIGNAKFVFILRDPVARMWSHIRMTVLFESARGTKVQTLIDRCRERAQLLLDMGRVRTVERGDYVRTIRELEAAVPVERCLYIFYEDLFKGEAPRQVCDFLGIKPIEIDSDKKVNPGLRIALPDDIRDAFREAFDVQYVGMKERFGDRLPAAWAD